MEEANRRVLSPWREWLPSPAWWLFSSRMRRLNSYIIALLRKRWAARRAGNSPAKQDLLERILTAVEVRSTGSKHSFGHNPEIGSRHPKRPAVASSVICM